MSQEAIFGPVFAMVALTFVVWVFMYVRRIHFLTANDIAPDQLTSPGALEALTPPDVAWPSDNLKNLFELPVLFYALVLVLYATGRVDVLHVGAAWTFVAFRTLHSAVHCTVNVVMLRFWLYLISALALWLLAGRAALGWLTAS